MIRTEILTFDIDKGTSRESIDNSLYSSQEIQENYNFNGKIGESKKYTLYDHRLDTTYWNSLSISKKKDIIRCAALAARLYEYDNPEDYRYISLADAITVSISFENPIISHI